MQVKEYIQIVKSDLTRYGMGTDMYRFIRCYICSFGFKYTFWMRTARFLKSKGTAFMPVYLMARLVLSHYGIKFGISIPYNTEIGPGLYIGHFGGIVVNPQAVIGRNCNINHEVTIGAAYGGRTPGVPVIGDNVYFGPGSKIIGGINIGNHVAVGANCVLTKSVAVNAVVAGIPGVVISEKSSSEYVTNTV